MLQLLDRTVRALGSDEATSEVIKVDVGSIYTGSFGTRYFPKGVGPNERVEREVTYNASSGAVSLDIGDAAYTGVVPPIAMRGPYPYWSLKTLSTIAKKTVLKFEPLGNYDVSFTVTES
jgi:hypothetical protein